MAPPYFLDGDPREMRVPPSRASGADPYKLQRQIAQFVRLVTFLASEISSHD